MGYYLPITDYQGQQYRRRIERRTDSPHHIERSYKIVFYRVKEDDRPNRKLLYHKAKKQSTRNETEKRKRFSRRHGQVEGKGERINVQV